MRVNPALEALGGYAIGALQEKARAMRAAGVALIDFSLGDPREPTPAFIPEALKRAVPEVSQYPTTRGLEEVRSAVAEYVRRRLGVVVDPATQVLVVSGSKEAIFSSHLAFVDRDASDTVIWPTPGYPIYERGAMLAGADGHAARLSGDFVFHPESVPEDVWARAAMAWVCTPHNPTGAVMTAEDLAGTLYVTRANGALMCSDECYLDLYEDDPPASVLQVAGSEMEGVLSFLSLSKRSGMTGYRSGAVVGDAAAIEALTMLRGGTGTASAEFVQSAAAAAWSDDAHVEERRDIFARKRAILRPVFERAGMAIVASRAGLYLWVEVGDDVALVDRLLAAGIVASPGGVFGPGGEGYLRLALVPTVDECERAVEVLESCLIGS